MIYTISFPDLSLKVEFSEETIKRIWLFQGPSETSCQLPDPLKRLRDEVGLYLEGSLRRFSSYPMDFSGLRSFTMRVLDVVKTIPYGSVLTYGDVARRLGGAKFSRAVGLSLSKNPFPLLIPCHRVVGSRSIGGFSQGVGLKKFLLSIEGVL